MVLAYHNIADAPGFYTLSQKAFERHLSILRDRGLRFVSAQEYLESLGKEGRSSRDSVLLTFDDAFISFQTNALPILERLGASAALFVPTGFIGRSDEWNEPQHRSPIFSEEDLKTVAAHPLVTIGSHTVSHKRLTKLDDAALRREMEESKDRLEHITAQSVTTIAYPYGQPYLDADAHVAKAARAAGYSAGFTTRYGISNRATDAMMLSRVDMSMVEDEATFTRLLKPWNRQHWKTLAKTAVSFLRTRF